MTLTRPNSSSSEFCSGVAVSSSFGQRAVASAMLRGDLVGRLVDVPQAMGFVDDHHVPRHAAISVRLGGGEVVRADDDLVLLIEWIG